LQKLQWVDFLLSMNFEATYPAHMQELLKALEFHLERSTAREAARKERQEKHAKGTRLRLAGGIALYTLLIVLLAAVIARIFFPTQIVKLVPVIQQVPVFTSPPTPTPTVPPPPNSITLSADSTRPGPGATVTLIAMTNTSVDGTGYVIEIWGNTLGVELQLAVCGTGSTCQIAIAGPSTSHTVTYQAYVDTRDPSTAVASSNTVSVT
jgi:hypothetical protein